MECAEGEVAESGQAVSLVILDVDQRSDEWRLARLGRLTSSRAADMLIAKGEAKGRRHYLMQLALERVTGRSQERSFQTAAMKHGVDTEGAAVAAYEVLTGRVLYRTGFVYRTDLMVGASLDGHVGGEDITGIVEIKCPMSATHWDYLRTNKVPTDYLKQITHALFVTGAEWCDFMSYDDAFPERLQAKLVRVTRADVDIPEYKKKALAFLDEVKHEAETINTLANLGAQLKAAVA